MMTDEQIAAIGAIGGDVCVAAGAGSGKTRVLTERYVHLLVEKNRHADQIVTITFTEAAAAEMRDRIARLLLDRGETRRLREMESGYISTIHAFCLRMLKEYALDVDIDPNSRLLSEVEAARYRVHRREEMLAEYPDLQFIVDRYRIAEAFHAVFMLIRHGREHGLTPDAMVERYAMAQGPFLDLLATRCHQHALRLQQWLVRSILSLADIHATPGSDAIARRDNAVALARSYPLDRLLPVENLHDELRASLLRWPTDGGEMLEQARQEIVEKTRGGKRDFWQWFEPDTTRDREFARHREIVLRIAAEEWRRFDQFKADGGYVDFLDMLTAARDLFAQHRDRFLARFSWVLVDEFQDTNPVQTEIIELLTNGQNTFVVGDARQSIYRFRQADVDVFRRFERRAQCGENGAIRLALSQNFRSVPPILDFVNTFFAELWSERDTDLARDPLRPGRDLAAEASAWRTTDTGDPAATEKADAVGISGPRVEVMLFDSRDVKALAASEAEKQSQKPGDRENALRWERVAYEAEQISRRIRNLVEVERPLIFDPHTKRFRRLRYRDIAILMVARTHLDGFETVFDSHHLPYVSLGGRAFFSRPEIVDLTNALAVVVNPRNDIQMAALWRSPLVGFSDDTLFWLAHALSDPSGSADDGDDDDRKTATPAVDFAVDVDDDLAALAHLPGARRTRRPLIDVLALSPDELPAPIPPDQRELFARFQHTLFDLATRQSSLSCAETIEAWLDATDLRTRLQTESGAPQALANIDKFIRMAREFEMDGRQPLATFVDSLLECRQAEVQEPDAPPIPEPGEDSPDAVRIMTVHAAKGLEFPVVFVPDLGRNFTFVGSERDERGRWMKNPWKPSTTFGAVAQLVSAPEEDAESTLAYEIERADQAEADRDEAKRVFYVACTRAREMLFLSGHCDQRGPIPPPDLAENPAQWLRRFIELRGRPIIHPAHRSTRSALEHSLPRPSANFLDLDLRGSSVRRWRDIPALADAKPVLTLAEYVRDQIRDGQPLRWPAELLGRPAVEFRSPVETHAVQVVTPTALSASLAPIVPTTALATYLHCPVRYYLRYMLDLRPADVPSPNRGPGEVDFSVVAGPLAMQADDACGERTIEPTDDLGLLDAAADVGTLTHRVLQALQLGRLLPGRYRLETLQQTAAEACRYVGVPDELVPDVHEMLERFFTSRIADELATATNVEQHVPFRLPLNAGTIVGAVDLVYRFPLDGAENSGAADEWVVVDFKTTPIATQRDFGHAVADYHWQIGLYALGIALRNNHQLPPPQQPLPLPRIRTELVFLRTGDVSTLRWEPADLASLRDRAQSAMQTLSCSEFAPPPTRCFVCDVLDRPRCPPLSR